MQIFSPSTINLWPGHRPRGKNNNKGSKISTGPLYYSIVGTVKMGVSCDFFELSLEHELRIAKLNLTFHKGRCFYPKSKASE